ncbi:ABC transporter ATP-binding protein [Sinorhizobium meliloti]|uniref:ABC transporter ATP-binding protein n=1 Tax=Rhizobium meliloti TaxID=382 RepID=UPI00398D4401
MTNKPNMQIVKAPPAILSIRDLSVRLPGGGDRDFAVKGVSIDVHPGEIVCLVGESGSGKSVTAASVMRLNPLPVDHGKILLEGEDLVSVSKPRLRQLRGTRMSMIFQEPMTALNPMHRVGDQVAELLLAHSDVSKIRDRRSAAAVVEKMFGDVHLPDPAGIMSRYPHQLSGGQRQRIMIAMALIMKPALVIADEPTTALDVTTQAQILSLLRELQKANGAGILFITHDFGVVADIADRIVVMRRGEIVEQGCAADVLYNPQHDYTKALIAAVPKLIPRETSTLARPPVLVARNLTKVYPTAGSKGRGFRAVDDIGLAVHQGQTLGIVGESGSGKSTAARCIARLIQPSSGQVVLGDTDIATLGTARLRPFRRRMQMIFQDPYRSLNPRITVGMSIIEGPLNYGVSRSEAEQRAKALLGMVSLDPSAFERYPHQFSGGQRQRIAIARALIMDPELIIADEAVSALDVSVQAQVLDVLENIRDQMNLSILFITHDLRVASRLCDHIAVMRHGKVVEFSETAKLFACPKDPYTQELLSALPGRDWLESTRKRELSVR